MSGEIRVILFWNSPHRAHGPVPGIILVGQGRDLACQGETVSDFIVGGRFAVAELLRERTASATHMTENTECALAKIRG